MTEEANDNTAQEANDNTAAKAKTAEGVKFDGDKIRTDLLPIKSIMDWAEVLTFGADKYKDRNWEKGLDWSRCYGACLRHLFAWWDGETNDIESGLNHLAHAMCNIGFLLEFEKTHPELDNRPSKEE